MTDETPSRKDLANAIRALAMDAVQAANSGHPGMPMGMADVATVLFTKTLKYDPANPDWPDRDRFVLSAGHGSMLLYALAYLTGYEAMTLENIRNFRQLGFHTPGHPERMLEIGVETTTGPLGQGLGNAVGMALAERLLAAHYGEDLVNHHTYVIASDGDLMEGVSHEAASIAGHLKLGKLIVLYDDNGISIDGATDLSFSEDIPARFKAYGWSVSEIDGHDPDAVAEALDAARNTERPSLICCKTTIGYGAPNKGGTAGCHGSPLGESEIELAREQLGWPHPPFEIPEAILNAWRRAGQRGAARYEVWQGRVQEAGEKGTQFLEVVAGALPEDMSEALGNIKAGFLLDKPEMATRAASGEVLNSLTKAVPAMIGGSADLTGSNNTYAKGMTAVTREDFSGRYIHWGVREHGMAAAMNGMALHGGLIPYSGTFLCFSDYCRPSIRLAALMKQRVIHVMTHDSIGLGEDGPTHQPVEHLAALRAMPNLNVLRPADGVEVAECWQIALESSETPSILVLSRQSLPTLRETAGASNPCAKGGYIMREAAGAEPKLILMASGSELGIANEARKLLEEAGIPTRLVSVPCMELLAQQEDAYIEELLPPDVPRLAIEAGGRQSWDYWIGSKGGFVGMTGFGDSAPAEILYEHFGITAEAVSKLGKKLAK